MKSKVLIWIASFVAAAALIAAAVWFVLFRVNVFSLEVTLTGEQTVTVEYGESYGEPGAEAVLRGSMFLQEGIHPERIHWTVNTDLNEQKLGRYTVSYSAELWNWHGEAQRTVNVVDTTSPRITLVEDGEIPNDRPYEEAGFTATDNYDGDITERVRRIEEPGLITYAVVDSSGNPAYVTREVPIYQTRPPEIILEGGAHVVITTGSFYSDPGYRAVDSLGQNLTEEVEVEGEVLWYQSGTYLLTYRVCDDMGNETVAERTVEVAAKDRPQVVYPQKKTIYLTFDDGPGPYTRQLLDTLDAYGAKATFFVTDSGYGKTMAEIVRRGHAIGIHTVSHDYASIYSGPEAYFEDLYRMQDVIYENTGVRTTLMRFPGGSSNTVSRSSCEGLMTILTQSVQDAGFQYFDWNVDSNDAGGAKKASTVLKNVREGVVQQKTSVVLQHDIHAFSVDAVEDILIWGLNNGYQFEALTPSSPGFHHGVNN